jgi:hypothetical protein
MARLNALLPRSKPSPNIFDILTPLAIKLTAQAADIAKHVEDLCNKHQITILNRSSHGGRASKKDRTISINPVKTQRTYITALHELGHIVGRGRSGTRLQQEAAAWQYVLDKSIVALTSGTYRAMLRFLGTYLKASERAARRKTGRYVLPKEDDPFWATYNFIKERAGT